MVTISDPFVIHVRLGVGGGGGGGEEMRREGMGGVSSGLPAFSVCRVHSRVCEVRTGCTQHMRALTCRSFGTRAPPA